MKIQVVGQTGFVGKHVVRELHKRNHEVLDNLSESPDAIIYLPWAGLPNYESVDHYRNIPWQKDFLQKAVNKGVRNITVTGTCLETVPSPPHYAIAKLALRALLFEMLPEIKWARMWYLYGEGQSEDCLLPKLRKAEESSRFFPQSFSVVNGERDFIDVAKAAEYLCSISEQSELTGVIDVCTGKAQFVASFCRQYSNITLHTDYPLPKYEPYSFHGDRSKIDRILEHAR